MAAAIYTTDLQLITDAESGDSWAELSGWAQGDVAAEGETDYYIQGSSCASSDFNNKTGLHSNVVDYGSNINFAPGDCAFVWHVILPGNAMETYANGGLVGFIGASTTNFNGWDVGGSDYGRNPYGGWQQQWR